MLLSHRRGCQNSVDSATCYSLTTGDDATAAKVELSAQPCINVFSTIEKTPCTLQEQLRALNTFPEALLTP